MGYGSFVSAKNWRHNRTYLYGLDLFNEGFYWEAHEAWGELFRSAFGLDAYQRFFFQALVQLAAAMVHVRNKKKSAAFFTYEKGRRKIAAISAAFGDQYLGLHLKHAVAAMDAFFVNQCQPQLKLDGLS
ncbi:MAG: hypothetical protein CR997_09125 [Acidobacteria bacterium]|nr:MAG: hypothetical protein CR997_09125 [Acidobacteriota bacterium]